MYHNRRLYPELDPRSFTRFVYTRVCTIFTRYIVRGSRLHALLGFEYLHPRRSSCATSGSYFELIVRNSAAPSVAESSFFTLPTTFTVALAMGVLVGILIGLSRLAADGGVHHHARQRHQRGMFMRTVSITITVWAFAMINILYPVGDHPQRPARRAQVLPASFEMQPHVFYEEFRVHSPLPAEQVPQQSVVLRAASSWPIPPNPPPPRSLSQPSVVDDPWNICASTSTPAGCVPAPDQCAVTTFAGANVPMQIPQCNRLPRSCP